LPLQVYRALAREHSRGVGRLVDFVDQAGLGEEVLFVYTSDNGPESTHKYFIGKGSTDPFRGDKRSLYDGGIRVPTFVRWNNHIPEERTVMTPASTIDIFPTLVRLAELNVDTANDIDTVQGRDLSCLWLGQCSDSQWIDSLRNDPNIKNEGEIIWEWREDYRGDCLSWSARFAVRWDRYKLHLQPQDKDEKRVTKTTVWSRIELYDIINDSLESTNLHVVRQGDPQVSSTVSYMMGLLVNYTASSAYDVSKWPKSTIDNRDWTRVDFELGTDCHDFDDNGNYKDPDAIISIPEAEYLTIVS